MSERGISDIKPRVYVETTVVSYLTARPARDIVVAGHQQSTRDWWTRAETRFELVISDLVYEEAGAGDPDAARKRLNAIASLVQLEATPEAQMLTERLVAAGAIPERAVRDAAHIAIAAANGVEYLVTWNFRHIANAMTRMQIESVCRRSGVESPVICSPDELMEDINDEE